jgi:hypothetical protein
MRGSMMRKARILGLMLGAMLAMSAAGAVSASADTLTAQGYPAVLTGVSEPEFKDVISTTAGTASCTETKYDGTISGAVTTAGSIKLTPTHSGCTAFGFPGTVHSNGCFIELKVLAGTAGTINLECPAGFELTAIASGAGTVKCTMHIKTQTNIPGTVKFTNTLSGGTVEASLTGIHYTHTLGTGVGSCFGSGTGTNGTLAMKASFTAESETGTATTMALE